MSTTKRDDPLLNLGPLGGSRPSSESAKPTETAADYPILTEVVDNPIEPDASPRNIGLDELERELRVELVGQMAADLEKRIESRVYGRLSTSVEEVAGRIRTELFTEIRGAVREAVAEVLAEEKKLARTASPDPVRTNIRDR
ncbi:MAG: hypothetical protein ACKVQU_05040 [Burkholderiales bacterium]